MYPVRSGQGRAVETILSGGAGLPTTADQSTALASTSLFRRGDVVFRLVEVAGDLDVGLRHLRAAASRSPSTQALVDHLGPGWDLRNTDGFNRFLSECAMNLIVDRRVTD
jgi:hypothetical protein